MLISSFHVTNKMSSFWLLVGSDLWDEPTADSDQPGQPSPELLYWWGAWERLACGGRGWAAAAHSQWVPLPPLQHRCTHWQPIPICSIPLGDRLLLLEIIYMHFALTLHSVFLSVFYSCLPPAEKRGALKAELDRLKGAGPSSQREQGGDMGVTASKGSISLLELRLPLKADFVCSTANNPGRDPTHNNCYLIISF